MSHTTTQVRKMIVGRKEPTRQNSFTFRGHRYITEAVILHLKDSSHRTTVSMGISHLEKNIGSVKLKPYPQQPNQETEPILILFDKQLGWLVLDGLQRLIAAKESGAATLRCYVATLQILKNYRESS